MIFLKMPRKKYSNTKILVASAFVIFPCGFTTFHVRVMTFSSLVELPCKENRFKGKTDGEIWKRSPVSSRNGRIGFFKLSVKVGSRS